METDKRIFDIQSLKARSAESKVRHRAQSVIVEDKELANVHDILHDTMEAARKSGEWSSVIPEVVLGCIWWSVVYSFPAVIYHSSLVEKNPAGCELLTLCYLSPLFVTRYPTVKKLLDSPVGLLLTRLGLLLALFAHQTNHSVARLSLTTIGNMFVPLILHRLWWISEPLDRSRKVYLHLLGYLLLLVLRVYWLTTDPMCSSHTFNCLAIVVGIAASVYLFFSDIPVPVNIMSKTEPTRRELRSDKKKLSAAVFNQLVVATMFGGMLFITNWLYGEVSVLASITGTSLPYQGGVAVMLALCTGLVIISDKRHLVGHPVWCCIGIGSGLAFCLLPSSRAFTAGCCLALFCMSLWPHVFECVLHHPPFPLVSIAMGVYLVLIMIHALVTGHDYIPGVSALLSGRPVVLMSFVLGVIVLGIQKVWVPISTTPQQSGPMQRRRSSRNSYVSFFGSAWRRLSTVSEESSSDETSDTEDVIEDEVISREENVLERLPVLKEVEYKIFLSVIRQATFVMCLTTIFGLMLQSIVPAVPVKNTNNEELSVVVWSAKFGFTTDGRLDLSQAPTMLNATGADIIVVTECDTFHPLFGSYHLIHWLAKSLNMFSFHADIAYTTGLGVISRHPIINSTHQLLPVKGAGLHIMVNITVNASGSLINLTFIKPRHHWQQWINCTQLYTKDTSVVEELSNLSQMAMVHFALCHQDTAFHLEGLESIPVSKKESGAGHILYKNLIRLCYVNTERLVVVLFKVPQHSNHDNDVVAMDTDNLVFHWDDFLNRFFGDRQQESVTCF